MKNNSAAPDKEVVRTYLAELSERATDTISFDDGLCSLSCLAELIKHNPDFKREARGLAAAVTLDLTIQSLRKELLK